MILSLIYGVEEVKTLRKVKSLAEKLKREKLQAKVKRATRISLAD